MNLNVFTSELQYENICVKIPAVANRPECIAYTKTSIGLFEQRCNSYAWSMATEMRLNLQHFRKGDTLELYNSVAIVFLLRL